MANERIRKNLHIRILRFAHRRGEFTDFDLHKGLSLNKAEIQLYSSKLRHDSSLIDNTGKTRDVGGGNEQSLFTLSSEGRFRLLEHQQLVWAQIIGVVAIVLSVLVAVSTTIVQLTSPVRIRDDRLNNLEAIVEQQEVLNDRVGNIEQKFDNYAENLGSASE